MGIAPGNADATAKTDMTNHEQLAARAREVEGFFHAKAERIDELARARWDDEVAVLATTTLDALGAVWFCDFPTARTALEREHGGTVPASIRMARLLAEFASTEIEAQKVAVVCFAEDLARHKRRLGNLASKLLDPRVPDRGRTGLGFGELPRSYLDKTQRELLEECPELLDTPGLGPSFVHRTRPARR